MMTSTATRSNSSHSGKIRPKRKPKGEITPTPEALRKLSPNTSLNDIERGTGISVSHLSRVFNGLRKFSADNLQAVAGYLGVSVDKLLAELAKVA